jgi:hypothetical protein
MFKYQEVHVTVHAAKKRCTFSIASFLVLLLLQLPCKLLISQTVRWQLLALSCSASTTVSNVELEAMGTCIVFFVGQAIAAVAIAYLVAGAICAISMA